MKPLVLFFLHYPKEIAGREWDVRQRFLVAVERSATLTTGGRRLAESVWLLDRDNDVSVLAHLVALADNLEAPYEVKFLRED